MKFVNDAIIEKARLLEQHQHELMDVLGIPEDDRSFAKVIRAVKVLKE